MQLSKVTYALVAAGVVGGLATFYQQIDGVTPAHAAQPTAVTQAVIPTAASNLPDFTALVDRAGAAVVNISVRGERKVAMMPGQDEDEMPDPMREFFKRFGGGIPDMPQARPQPMQGMGSGFIVSPDGYIVTNAHVVDGASEVTVKLTDRREFTAKVLGADKRTDIALIKIEAKDLPALDLAAKPEVKKGEWVIAIGSPFGFENSVSAGVVSGMHRALPNGQMVPFIQTDVAVNPGNSGGPLLNSKGQVVGVNSQIYSRSGGYMGLSFAIPADVAVRVADQIKTHGKVQHGRLGVGIQGLDQALAQSFGLKDPNGAVVGTVEKGGPADKAGFKVGDIIRKIEGTPVVDSTDVTSRIGNTAPGTRMSFEVWREGKPVELTATIGTLDDGKKVASVDEDAAAKGKLGVAVRPLTPEEKKEGTASGVVVERAGGAAARAGIQPGDVIVGVGSEKVSSPEQLKSLIDKSDKTVALLIERQGRQIFVPVKIG
jgi:serine protease Do